MGPRNVLLEGATWKLELIKPSHNKSDKTTLGLVFPIIIAGVCFEASGHKVRLPISL